MKKIYKTIPVSTTTYNKLKKLKGKYSFDTVIKKLLENGKCA